MIASRCISFANEKGQMLYGILHEPEPRTARGVCILLLSPGIKGRVGPHRLYLKIAARLVPLGFHVLRFDYYGLGDSEGELSERVLADMYNSIQGGRYVGDTVAAMDWVQSALGIRRFVGSGLCGGSISALLTAAKDARIECLLGLGLPTALEGGPENWARSLTQGQLETLRGGYLRKLGDVRAWMRLLSGKTNYSVLWRSLKGVRSRPAAQPPAAEKQAPDNTNPRFAAAFRTVVDSGRPMLLAFSANDRMHFEFEEKFEARNPDVAARKESAYRVAVIPNANHVLSDRAAMDTFLQLAEGWLEERFGQ